MGTGRRDLTCDQDLEMSPYWERLCFPALSSGTMQTPLVWEAGGENRRVGPELVYGDPHPLLPPLMVPT